MVYGVGPGRAPYRSGGVTKPADDAGVSVPSVNSGVSGWCSVVVVENLTFFQSPGIFLAVAVVMVLDNELSVCVGAREWSGIVGC